MRTRLDRMRAAKVHLAVMGSMLSEITALMEFYHGKEATKAALETCLLLVELRKDEPEGPALRQCEDPKCEECKAIVEQAEMADDTETTPDPLTPNKEVEK